MYTQFYMAAILFMQIRWSRWTRFSYKSVWRDTELFEYDLPKYDYMLTIMTLKLILFQLPVLKYTF